jgi:hypothetical protein
LFQPRLAIVMFIPVNLCGRYLGFSELDRCTVPEIR